jgi:hypothetical protein
MLLVQYLLARFATPMSMTTPMLLLHLIPLLR